MIVQLKLSGVTPTATARMFIRIVTVRDEGAVLWPFSLWFYYVDTFSKFYGEDFPLLDEKEFYVRFSTLAFPSIGSCSLNVGYRIAF